MTLESLENATKTSRQTFLDREMPFIEVVKRGIKFRFTYVTNFINSSGDWDYKTIEKDFEFSNLNEALKSKLWTGSVYDESMELVGFYNPIIKKHETLENLNEEREREILSFLNKHIM
ncbi:hypothetical protein ACOL3H_06490 [Aliarcobacter butzleri]